MGRELHYELALLKLSSPAKPEIETADKLITLLCYSIDGSMIAVLSASFPNQNPRIPDETRGTLKPKPLC